MSKLTPFDKIQKALFLPEEQAKGLLTEIEFQTKMRYERIFTFWHQNPHLSDSRLIDFMINSCNMSKSTAYYDLRKLKQLLGNVKVASKEWHRHMVIEMCKKAYAIAQAQSDAKGMALAADKIGKYTKLDKDEAEELPWDTLIPPNFEPDPDVSILGITRDTNIEVRRSELRNKYLKKYDPSHFQEAVIVDDETN